MARRRYRRYRRARGRWSSNLTRVANTGVAPAAAEFVDFYTIAQNNTTTSTNTISQVFTVKNVEVSAQLEGAGGLQNIEYYIMYVPEGYALSANLPEQHSEWIMAYKFLGSPCSQNTSIGAFTSQAQPPRIRTRLARKLNTGDQIVFIIRGVNTSDSTQNIIWNGLVRWWTKAN